MKNLLKDIKGNRPLLIKSEQAAAYLERTNQLTHIPLGTKISDIGEMVAAIFGEVQTYEKFPPYAVIPIKGVIGKNLSEMEKMCGCCDIQDVEEMLEDAVNDKSITNIIFHIDSPGGCSVGVPELANRIKNCSKNTIAFTDSEACSAAYWLGSQAKSFYATPSSTVGSVGVYIAYPDMSQAYANEGIKMDVIKAGMFKGAGIPGTSLDERQRAMLQEEVIDIWAQFKTAVKSVREFVEDSSMEGQTFSGTKAAAVGLVTGLINGFDELMESLDSAVAEQMEADEENKQLEADETMPEAKGKLLTASARALVGINLNLKPQASKKDDEEDDDEEEDGVPTTPDLEADKLPPKMDEDEEEDEDKDEKHMESKHIVISDFDGTIKNENEDEILNKSVARHLKKMAKAGREIHVVTGRHEEDRAKVSEYLAKHNVEHHGLHMKQEADERATPYYKVDVVGKIEAEGHHIAHIVENDEHCAEAYTEAGWHCIHPDTVKKMDDEADAEEALETEKKQNDGAKKRHKGRTI